MLTCSPCGTESHADSTDAWRAITLRLSSAYPTEPPSLIVRASKDSPHGPQVTHMTLCGLSSCALFLFSFLVNTVPMAKHCFSKSDHSI